MAIVLDPNPISIQGPENCSTGSFDLVFNVTGGDPGQVFLQVTYSGAVTSAAAAMSPVQVDGNNQATATINYQATGAGTVTTTARFNLIGNQFFHGMTVPVT